MKAPCFAASQRVDYNSAASQNPGPDKYTILGDFDFQKDPSDPNNRGGKKPRFAFGIKIQEK